MQVQAQSEAKVKGKRKINIPWRSIYRNRAIYLFISPFYILFFIFGLFPMVFSIYLAFNQWDGIGEMEFVGFRNFKFLLTDHAFWQALWNTLVIWVLSTVPMLIFALVIAFLIHQAVTRFKGFYRVIYFLPNVTSIVAVTIIFESLFGNKFGLLNFVLKTFGLNPIAWLDSPFWIKVAIAVMVTWRFTGYNAILYLAGLQRIPNDLYEAARIDGANLMQMFFKITLPLLKPIILFTVIMSTIGGLQIFTEPQILVGESGGPAGGGTTVVLYLYQQAFKNQYFGYGATVSIALFVLVILFSIINWKLIDNPKTK